MKFIRLILISIFIISTTLLCHAEEVKVGLEPFPPLIKTSTTGYTVIMLKEIEKISDFKFYIKIMPYNRAKLQLKTKKIDLMGHTPSGVETKEFYAYAQDINWQINTFTDLYGIKKENVEQSKLKTMSKIGTPRGNVDFFSELLGIPAKQFYEGEIGSLLKMLKKGRIEVFIFERASTMSTIKKHKIDNIFYKMVDISVPAGLAVRTDDEGEKLKKKLDKLIKKLDTRKIFGPYLKYINLPKHGIVDISGWYYLYSGSKFLMRQNVVILGSTGIIQNNLNS